MFISRKYCNAFSLVELSIVLVILGLLTGGILTGQSLIRAAELRAATTEFSQYQTAINTFREKYFALPGDMSNATTFWQAADNNPATCITTQGTGTQTCNGNGDGRIGFNGSLAISDFTPYEYLTAWKHLANAGLVNGNFTGISGSAGNQHHVIGSNCPASKVSNAGWGLILRGADATNVYDNSRGINLLQFGGQQSTNNTNTLGILTPEEAWNIDTKMDDGKPGQGKILTHTRGHSLCPTSNTATSAEYDLLVQDKTCHLLFLLR